MPVAAVACHLFFGRLYLFFIHLVFLQCSIFSVRSCRAALVFCFQLKHFREDPIMSWSFESCFFGWLPLLQSWWSGPDLCPGLFHWLVLEGLISWATASSISVFFSDDVPILLFWRYVDCHSYCLLAFFFCVIL